MIEKHLPGDDRPHSGWFADGIVVSSRVRLLRNLADFPFVTACSTKQLDNIALAIRSANNAHDRSLPIISLNQSELEERRFLMRMPAIESVVASNEVEASGSANPSNVPIAGPMDASDTTTSLIINEEDHLKVDVSSIGLGLEDAWRTANQMDDRLEGKLDFSFSPRWGYLTACPANVGTGMRASVVLHLPGLVMGNQINTVLRGLNRLNLHAREMWGAHQQSDFYRIGNQTTLGFDEPELIRQLLDAVMVIIDREKDSRSRLQVQDPVGLKSRIVTAFRSFLRADLDDTSPKSLDNTARLLSRCRLGAIMGLLEPHDVKRISDRLCVWKLNRELAAAVEQEDYQRASNLRDRIQILEGGLS